MPLHSRTWCRFWCQSRCQNGVGDGREPAIHRVEQAAHLGVRPDDGRWMSGSAMSPRSMKWRRPSRSYSTRLSGDWLLQSPGHGDRPFARPALEHRPTAVEEGHLHLPARCARCLGRGDRTGSICDLHGSAAPPGGSEQSGMRQNRNRSPFEPGTAWQQHRCLTLA